LMDWTFVIWQQSTDSKLLGLGSSWRSLDSAFAEKSSANGTPCTGNLFARHER
jgi:hypothetical protein